MDFLFSTRHSLATKRLVPVDGLSTGQASALIGQCQNYLMKYFKQLP